MAGNSYGTLDHLCDLYRPVVTGGTDPFNLPDQTMTLIRADVACRKITYPRLAHQETDAVRSAGTVMARFHLDPTLQPVLIGDEIRNTRDKWGTPSGDMPYTVMRVSETTTDSIERIVIDANANVAGQY